MRKLMYFIILFNLAACSYPTTSFWVNNDSNKEVHFTAGAYHIPSRTVRYLPFKVNPKDSVLVRIIGLKKTGDVTNVFENIKFLEPNGLNVKDPMIPQNWIRTIDEKGKPKYIYKIN